MSANPKADTVREFLEAFEEVFDKDWAHTKQMLGIRGDTVEEKRSTTEVGLETIPIISEHGTFIHPKIDDETEDWGNRGRLLAAYRALRRDLP